MGLWWWFSALVWTQDSGCSPVAALCKEDPIYSQPMNQVQPLPCALNLTPRNFPVSSWTVGESVALPVGWSYSFIDGGSHARLECHVHGSPPGACWWGRGRGGINMPWSDRWLDLKLSHGSRGVGLTSRTEDLPPQSQKAETACGVGLQRCGYMNWKNIVQKQL